MKINRDENSIGYNIINVLIKEDKCSSFCCDICEIHFLSKKYLKIHQKEMKLIQFSDAEHNIEYENYIKAMNNIKNSQSV